jgi:hypothetical protein
LHRSYALVFERDYEICEIFILDRRHLRTGGSFAAILFRRKDRSRLAACHHPPRVLLRIYWRGHCIPAGVPDHFERSGTVSSVDARICSRKAGLCDTRSDPLLHRSLGGRNVRRGHDRPFSGRLVPDQLVKDRSPRTSRSQCKHCDNEKAGRVISGRPYLSNMVPSVGVEPTTNGLCLPATPFDAPFGFVVWTFSSLYESAVKSLHLPAKWPAWLGITMHFQMFRLPRI